ncbi:choline BCCT transporter BetT [Corynebacterium ciconiae]|uniref:choline BCCT transporter BetT n=1 Tax=Corynebacterium ciconiae TaxID=227319 RepID=UPI0012E9A045|nr:choline BCCT transporter BetT [Corynebacterium ciconiae]
MNTSGDRVAAEKPQVNKPVFAISVIGVFAMVLWAALTPNSANAALGSITSWISVNLGWFYILTATAAVVFVLVIALARTGTVRLGPDHSRPQFGLFSWSAMLFAAGIGVDLIFFAVAEPVTMYYNPPVGDAETRQAAEDAVVFALFHYGISGWALYALMGMAFGYFAYRLNMPLALRSALYPLIGKRIHGPIGHSVDIAATLGTVFGIAASLGIGVVQLNYGLKMVFGIEEGPTAQIILVVVAVSVATISAVSGVDRGIKRLSELNVIIALVLMFFVVFTGRTAFLFDSLVMNVGDYAANFVDWTLDTYSFSETPQATRDWLASWTLFFWAWWVAWAPFVGLFLARISRGRTIRQFVFGTLTIPFLFIVMWMSFFGNSALDRIIGGDDEFGAVAMEEPQRGFYDLIQSYPAGMILVVLVTAVGLLLYITSADSGALVLSNFTSKIENSRQDGPTWSRIVWSVIVGVLTLVLLAIDGVVTVQNATIVMGLPFTVVIYLIMYSLWKSLRIEAYKSEARMVAIHSAMSGRLRSRGGWQGRLERAINWPSADDAQSYMLDVAKPAMEKVAQEIRHLGFDTLLLYSEVPDCEVSQLDLTVGFGDEKDFRFQIYPVVSEVPSYAGKATAEDQEYYRLEVHDLQGSLGYDVYGYSEEQLLNSVLDLFERHLEFLHMQAGNRGNTDVSDGAAPSRVWEEN